MVLLGIISGVWEEYAVRARCWFPGALFFPWPPARIAGDKRKSSSRPPDEKSPRVRKRTPTPLVRKELASDCTKLKLELRAVFLREPGRIFRGHGAGKGLQHNL